MQYAKPAKDLCRRCAENHSVKRWHIFLNHIPNEKSQLRHLSHVGQVKRGVKQLDFVFRKKTCKK